MYTVFCREPFRSKLRIKAAGIICIGKHAFKINVDTIQAFSGRFKVQYTILKKLIYDIILPRWLGTGIRGANLRQRRVRPWLRLYTYAFVPSRYSRVRWFVWSTKMVWKKCKNLVLVKKFTGKGSVYVRSFRFLITPFIAFLWYYRNFIPTILLIRRFNGNNAYLDKIFGPNAIFLVLAF